MQSTEAIKGFYEYLTQKEILPKVLSYFAKGRGWVKIDYRQIAVYSIELADFLLEDAQEAIKCCMTAIEQIEGNNKQHPRFFHLPKSVHKCVWQVRDTDVGKMIAIHGNINKVSDTLQICKSVRYNCNNCAHIINLLCVETMPRAIKKCPNCNSTQFRIIHMEMDDCIKVGITDNMMDEHNKNRSLPREKLAILEKDLACRDIDQLMEIGKKVIVNGYLYYWKHPAKQSDVEFTTRFMVNSIEFPEMGWSQIKFTNTEIDEFKEMGKDPKIISRLAESVVDVLGHKPAKIACILQLAGSPNFYNENKQLDSRGTIHILLIGDPGNAKSYIAKNFCVVSPIHAKATASNSSGKGLIASVVKDADVGNYAVHAGVIPMASGGVGMIDEFDKTHDEDYGDHNNAMNDMEVLVAKANVKAKLKTETSYLCTANPEHRVFSDYKDYIQQITMPKDLLDRFDLIIPILQPKKVEKQYEILDMMFDRVQKKNKKEKWNPEFTHEKIQKYIAFCRQNNPEPYFSRKIYENCKEKLTDLMKPKNNEEVKISFRHFESILRLALASARLRQHDVDEADIDMAIKLKEYSFRKLGIITESGTFDYSASEDIPEQKISQTKTFDDLFAEFFANKAKVDYEQFVVACENKGLNRIWTERRIENLKKVGDIVEPRNGILMMAG